MNRSDYQVVHESPHFVAIIDNDSGGKSVTNDAENVVQDLANRITDKRLIYRDSAGQWDEIIHLGGRFVDFRTLKGNLDTANIEINRIKKTFHA